MPSQPPPTLANRINTATRAIHTSLNTHMLHLLPLSLPPHTTNPQIYATGMRHIHALYSTLETTLQSLLAKPNPALTRRLTALRVLEMQGLWRTKRLESDLAHLTHGAHTLELQGLAGHPVLGGRIYGLVTRLSAPSIEGREHVLLAPFYLFYLALFNGGRYLRGILRGAGSGFWLQGNGGDVDDVLSFWGFGGEDGAGEGEEEKIKMRFKTSWERAVGMLTEGERAEVVDEAVAVMRGMEMVVREMGVEGRRRFGGQDGGRCGNNGGGDLGFDMGMRWLLLKHVLPMGCMELVIAIWWAGIGLLASMGKGVKVD